VTDARLEECSSHACFCTVTTTASGSKIQCPKCCYVPFKLVRIPNRVTHRPQCIYVPQFLLVIAPQDHSQMPSLPLAAPTPAPPWARPITSLPVCASPGGQEQSLGPARAPYGVYGHTGVGVRHTGASCIATMAASAAVSVGRASTVSSLPYAVRSVTRDTGFGWHVNSNAHRRR